MAIDPRISLGIQQPEPFDPVEEYGRALSIADLIQNRGIQRQVQQANIEQTRLENERIARQERAANEEAAGIQSALQIGGANEWTGSIDALRRMGTPGAVKMAGELETALSNREKAKRDAETAELEITGKKAARLGALAGSITDESSRDFAIGQALREGLLEKEQATEYLSAPFDDAFRKRLQSFRDQALTAQQQIEARLKQANEERQKRVDTETERHNRAMEGKGTDTSTPDIKEYKFAVERGDFTGSFVDYQRQQAEMKRSPDSGARGSFQAIVDENGVITSFYNPTTGQSREAPAGARKTAVPAAIREKASLITGTIADLDELERLAKSNSGSIGRFSGNVAAAKRWLVGAGAEVNELFRIADNLGDQLLRARSGAAITESEYARLRALIPDPRGPKDKFDSDLKGFRKETQRVQENLLKMTGGSPSVVPATGKADPMGIR